MKVYTLSGFDRVEKADASQLKRLISAGRIDAFRRAEGWVTIGIDPVRGIGGDYDGPERREIRQKPLEECPGVHYCMLGRK